ncbi:UDP-N-acetylmuramoyl-tripeptide--D-alanyl-D-alanine ligase [Anaerococcus sp. AGMB00486]|uniref:UDP-N-acetylmuramoyl-tripeptide--D-alanyl-D-alanine ligase n=1 Tax=Anaerococcus faecalis TaxID=2742993 RepID=A0ABX2NBA1_9FIRM|nr:MULTISPECIES: UDP-N-acetylmuramoyl-tripeptide--D-alanyl-D-alanine ligase [Anaerococcus]MDY3006911.1 UDP-N-acetylmuramoyl-tripeptide--D-alanyl-D-alanine ligase [Anaerococcus porci]NVF11757.1 UDP-N-acetylmuramoyl-tripeptide--D-alanyl-D-alanine ligase [Anaerococcus faecalis]
MIERTLGHICKMLGGEISDPSSSDVIIRGVSIDSRTIQNGNLYIPIVGEKFDGRIFIEECEKAGAPCFLIDKNFKVPKSVTIPYCIVDDTKKALQDLAKAYRNELDITIIALTGSNGKTTTKNLIHAVLSEKYRVEKTHGNLNNEIGVPRTILSFSDDTEIGVVEMGTDDFGEISLLTNIARPDIAAITNIGDAHLLKLKTREGIAKAKFEIIEGLKEDGLFIYNGDDEILKKVFPNYKLSQKVLTFGQNDDVDFKVKSLSLTNTYTRFIYKDEEYTVPLLGAHQVYNAALAVLIGKIFELSYKDINNGLLKASNTGNRNELIQRNGFDILNDAYKSNPQSLREGLNLAGILDGYMNKIAVLGDMLELGEDEEKLHYESGLEIDPKKIDYVLFYGPLSKQMHKASLKNFSKNRSLHFENKDDLIDKLKQIITKSSLVFVKGSRGLHMEEIIEAIYNFRI